LTWDDVRAFGKGIVLNIKAGKIPGAPGNRAELFPISDENFCPTKALERLKNYQVKRHMWGKGLPVFRRSSGLNLTKEVFLKTVNKALDIVRGKGERRSSVGGKSFRSGLLSALATFPSDFQEAHLKSLGRWKGKSYQFYMWNGPINFEHVYGKVTENLLKVFHNARKPKKDVVPPPGPQQQQRGRGRRRKLPVVF
jgi:hypothetical protein